MKKQKSGPNVVTVALAERMRDLSPMNAYAMRVWDGQSCSLPVGERVKRVLAALRAQNLLAEQQDLSLPNIDIGKYL